MKKFIAVFLSLAMVFTFAGCGSPSEEQPEEQIDYEIAMVTDSGLIMDGGYSEVAWKAISEFGSSAGVSHKYYKASEASMNAYRQTIDNAISKGAKVIVADGYSFADVVYEMQDKHKDVKFILIDAEPMENESGDTKIRENTTVLLFASEQAGYLAGYAAVKNGDTRLGFMGDAKQPTIMDYGYGFIQGADAAAQENNVSVSVNYHYCNSSEDREDVLERAAAWYKAHTGVILACGTFVEQPVIEAAELEDGEVIAYETDKSRMSDKILTSALKSIAPAIEDTLELYEDDEFPGGRAIIYDAENEGVGIEIENSKLDSISKKEYKKVLNDLKSGEITVKKYNSGSIESLDLKNVSVKEN